MEYARSLRSVELANTSMDRFRVTVALLVATVKLSVTMAFATPFIIVANSVNFHWSYSMKMSFLNADMDR